MLLIQMLLKLICRIELFLTTYITEVLTFVPKEAVRHAFFAPGSVLTDLFRAHVPEAGAALLPLTSERPVQLLPRRLCWDVRIFDCI